MSIHCSHFVNNVPMPQLVQQRTLPKLRHVSHAQLALVVLFAKTLMTTKNMRTQSKRKRQKQRKPANVARKNGTDGKSGTLSDALGPGYVINSTALNPMRSPEFKPVMEMLRANGEFDDEEDTDSSEES